MARPPKSPPRQPAPPAAETPRTLTQEKSDFTNEGSPPPGHVAGTTPTPATDDSAPAPPAQPVEPDEPAKPGAPATDAGPGRRQPPSPAGPVRRAAKGRPAAWRGNG